MKLITFDNDTGIEFGEEGVVTGVGEDAGSISVTFPGKARKSQYSFLTTEISEQKPVCNIFINLHRIRTAEHGLHRRDISYVPARY